MNWDGYATSAEAKAARDAEYRKLRADGIRCKRWVLKNQLRPYSGFGQEDGRICDVYMLDVNAL
jgi:hypothetical protein